MKLPITSRLTAVALTACISLGLVTSEAISGVRTELDQFNFGPFTTRALFPGINIDGPGVQPTDWYPVYLWRLPSDQCAFPNPIPIPPETLLFTDDHRLVTNTDLNDPTGVLHNLGCPLAFEGFSIFEEEPTPDLPVVPRLSKLTGNVPVYFVHSSDVDEKAPPEGDPDPFNKMTWGDLQDLVICGYALKGSAELKEVLQSEAPVDPDTLEPLPGGAQVPSFKISLKGYLDNGTPFSALAVGQGVPSNPPNVATVRTYKIKGLEYIERPSECVE